MTRIAAIFMTLLCTLPSAMAAEPPVTVFAAASLRGVLEDVASASDKDVRLSFGGSGTMARQVAAGAPADVVVLANDLWMTWLVEQNLTDMGQPQVIARNRLVLIAPEGTAALMSIDNIPVRLLDGRLAMGQRDGVPAGSYARQWLEHTGLWPQIKTRLAETDNVRAALTLVARGDVALGIVYATDAQAEPAVKVLLQAPSDHHDPIHYLAAALTPKGERFVTHLTDSNATKLFANHGFQPVHP